MLPTALTRHVGLSAGGWVLETLLKHYLDQIFSGREGSGLKAKSGDSGDLRRDELLYAEVFYIVKQFLDVSTHYPVEDLQQFSNSRTPSAPWMLVKRLNVPMSCCDAAANILIDVLGGEQKTRELVGGTKWWQVRGLKGVDAQWIVAKKDHKKIKQQRREHPLAQKNGEEPRGRVDEELEYTEEVNALKCILFLHGGGYYFGSTDQERYFIQRLARKSNARVLSVNYRLAPQYPFPCALQDALASYLYLIRPPKEAMHGAVKPSDIVVAGDSAGGGLTLALLQVLRDTSLPLPAGGIPISPWCDLTHSFPSIHTNTDSDVIPEYGLSMYRPSSLWPPPSDDLTEKVHAGLRARIKEAASRIHSPSTKQTDADEPKRPGFWSRLSFVDREGSVRASHVRKSKSVDAIRGEDVRAEAMRASKSQVGIQNGHVESNINLGTSAPVPTADHSHSQTLSVIAENGEKLVVKDQVHLYTVNNLVTHPLVSSACSYLGGLPPLFFIAGNDEVLRDEIIYTAHKAANPQKYHVKDDARQLYPKLEGIENRYGPTKVHLQVYDQTPHILPVLFGFCTPAKFCFRALASFNRHVWNVPLPPSKQNLRDEKASPRPFSKRSMSSGSSITRNLFNSARRRSLSSMTDAAENGNSEKKSTSKRSANRSLSRSRKSSASADEHRQHSLNTITSNVELDERYAGDPTVYELHPSPYVDNMIRERVSTRGKIRPLEPENELPACTMPQEKIGVANELALRRYLEGKAKWAEKYGRTARRVQKKRARHLALAKKDADRYVTKFQRHFFQDELEANAVCGKGKDGKSIKEGLKSAASWAWAWALDELEKPPPSSIVARRDTAEARKLSKIADSLVDNAGHPLNGNSLWTYLFSRLGNDKDAAKEHGKRHGMDESADEREMQTDVDLPVRKRSKSFLLALKKGTAPRRYASASAVAGPRQEESLQETEEEAEYALQQTQSH